MKRSDLERATAFAAAYALWRRPEPSGLLLWQAFMVCDGMCIAGARAAADIEAAPAARG